MRWWYLPIAFLMVLVVVAGTMVQDTTWGAWSVKNLSLRCSGLLTDPVPLGLVRYFGGVGPVSEGDTFMCRWRTDFVLGFALPRKKIAPTCYRMRIRHELRSESPGVIARALIYRTSQPFSLTAA